MGHHRSVPRRRRRLKVQLGSAPHLLTADVSTAGFSAESASLPPPGSEVWGTLLYRGQQVPFEGVVRWAKQGNPWLSMRGRFGVRFSRVSEAFLETFKRFG